VDRALDEALWQRDRGCVAPLIDRRAGPCRDMFGNFIPRSARRFLTRDHVRPDEVYAGAGGFGKRPADRLEHLCLVCPWHHQYGNPPWAETHRPEMRDYLRRKHLTARRTMGS
jgi:hypothetical protein